MHTTLISPGLLEAHLSDSSWFIADCRYNLKDEAWGRAQYVAGHIPGAVFVNLARDRPSDSRASRIRSTPSTVTSRERATGIIGTTSPPTARCGRRAS